METNKINTAAAWRFTSNQLDRRTVLTIMYITIYMASPKATHFRKSLFNELRWFTHKRSSIAHRLAKEQFVERQVGSTLNLSNRFANFNFYWGVSHKCIWSTRTKQCIRDCLVPCRKIWLQCRPPDGAAGWVAVACVCVCKEKQAGCWLVERTTVNNAKRTTRTPRTNRTRYGALRAALLPTEEKKNITTTNAPHSVTQTYVTYSYIYMLFVSHTHAHCSLVHIF